jgi:hypothetical protein
VGKTVDFLAMMKPKCIGKRLGEKINESWLALFSNLNAIDVAVMF